MKKPHSSVLIFSHRGKSVIDRKQIAYILIGLLLGSGITVGGLTLSQRVQPAPIIIVPPEPTLIPEPTLTPGPIKVFVNGAVAQAAVYELPPDSIVEQAIIAAGGFTEQANRIVVNLAQPLSNGSQVYVPSAEEVADLPISGINKPDIGSSNQANNQTSTNSGTNSTGLVNINRAGIDELDTLPGIGPSTAQKIVDYREENGLFLTIEAIMDVSGIGEAKFNQLKELITVEEE